MSQGNQARQVGVPLAGLGNKCDRSITFRLAHDEVNTDDGMNAGGEALLAELQRAAQVGHVGQTQGRVTVGEGCGHHIRG